MTLLRKLYKFIIRVHYCDQSVKVQKATTMGVFTIRAPRITIGEERGARLAPFDVQRHVETATKRVDDRPLEVIEMDRQLLLAEKSMKTAQRLFGEERINAAEVANGNVTGPVERIMDIAWDIPEGVISTKATEDMVVERISRANALRTESSDLSSKIRGARL